MVIEGDNRDSRCVQSLIRESVCDLPFFSRTHKTREDIKLMNRESHTFPTEPGRRELRERQTYLLVSHSRISLLLKALGKVIVVMDWKDSISHKIDSFP